MEALRRLFGEWRLRTLGELVDLKVYGCHLGEATTWAMAAAELDGLATQLRQLGANDAQLRAVLELSTKWDEHARRAGVALEYFARRARPRT